MWGTLKQLVSRLYWKAETDHAVVSIAEAWYSSRLRISLGQNRVTIRTIRRDLEVYRVYSPIHVV